MSKFFLVRLVVAGLAIMGLGVGLTVFALESHDRLVSSDLSFIGIILTIAGAAVIAMVVILWPRRPKMALRKDLEDVPPPPLKDRKLP
jgi:hypothetical protein